MTTMTTMKDFEVMKEKHLDRLAQYVPVVARVHGQAHPVFYKVEKVYGALVKEMAAGGDLSALFTELSQLTGGYRVPDDVCESYEAVYAMLEDLDRAYPRPAELGEDDSPASGKEG